jgi:hypothetical protein
MTTTQIKKAVKELTGYEYVAVRKGTGSLRGNYTVFTSCNDMMSLRPFEKQLREMFSVEIFSDYTVTIKA